MHCALYVFYEANKDDYYIIIYYISLFSYIYKVQHNGYLQSRL